MASIAVLGQDSACSISSWEIPVSCGTITRIRTVKAEDLPTVLKILEVWRKIYTVIPKDISKASQVILYCKIDVDSQVLVAENVSGVAEAFARVHREEWGSRNLRVEELIVAPWNNTSCIKYTKGMDWILVNSHTRDIVDHYKVDPTDFAIYKPYTGTLMMYGVLRYAGYLKVPRVDLFSLKQTREFYTKLGFKEEWAMFAWDLADGLPIGLLERMRRNFPEEILC